MFWHGSTWRHLELTSSRMACRDRPGGPSQPCYGSMAYLLALLRGTVVVRACMALHAATNYEGDHMDRLFVERLTMVLAVAFGVIAILIGVSPAKAEEISYAFGYALANNPRSTASSYTPTSAYSYNSSGETITITQAAPEGTQSGSGDSVAKAQQEGMSR